MLSATVVAVTPGVGLAVDAGPASAGLVAGSVRLEPMAGSEGLTVAGTGTYRGAVDVRRNGRALAVVNHLPLEDYVRGIDEVPPSWPAAALQAQAIAARTYAAHRALTGDARWRAVGADICATSTCQVYRGLDAERRAQGYGWLAAVGATAGRALLEGGRPIMASYSSTANGPRAMSQNGALDMARQGRSASDILQSYYGVRPTPAGDRLPATIKVAVAMTSASVRVSAAGAFRVVDGAGTELAAAGAGEWRIVPAGGGLRVVPPETFRAPPPVEAPVPAEPVAPRAARAILAGSPAPRRGPWAGVALVLIVVATGAGITLSQRRAA